MWKCTEMCWKVHDRFGGVSIEKENGGGIYSVLYVLWMLTLFLRIMLILYKNQQ